MKVIDGQNVYDFPNIKETTIHADNVLLAFVEDTVYTWQYTGERREAIRQVLNYHQLTSVRPRWISVLESAGFHNPSTPYDTDGNPSDYKISE